MKRTILATCTAAALGLAMTASAQQPPQPSQPTPPAQAAGATLDKEMKLSGCLKAGRRGTFELATGKKDKAAAADAAGAPAPAQDAMAKAAPKNVTLAPAAPFGVALVDLVHADAGHRGAEASADLGEDGRVLEVGGGLDDGLAAGAGRRS